MGNRINKTDFIETEINETNEKKDLNDITEFNDLKLHTKQLQEDLWSYYNTVKMFKIKLEELEKNKKDKFKINFFRKNKR